MDGELYTITEPDLTLAKAAEILGVSLAHIDARFGVVWIDPGRHMYAVRVYGHPRVHADPRIEGPWSEPTIEKFDGPAWGPL